LHPLQQEIMHQLDMIGKVVIPWRHFWKRPGSARRCYRRSSCGKFRTLKKNKREHRVPTLCPGFARHCIIWQGAHSLLSRAPESHCGWKQ
jgi:hypothetical protein